MPPLQEEYQSIVEQLDAFLQSADVDGAVRCITSTDLMDKIQEIAPPPWLGLRERQVVTLERLKAVVTTIRQGIFCGEGHLFYIVIRSASKEEGADYEYPTTRRDKTIQYSIHDEDVYFIDIKDLSGNRLSTNLYAYDKTDTLVTDYPNPFNLTQPRTLEMSKRSDGTPQHKYLPYGLRVYGFGLDEDDTEEIVTLKNDTNGIVLTLNFEYKHASVHNVNFLLNALIKYT